MNKVIMETNERTKEKATELLKNIIIDDNISVGDLLKSHNNLVKIVEKQEEQIKVLQKVNIQLIKAIKQVNLVAKVNNINIIESIKELGGNI